MYDIDSPLGTVFQFYKFSRCPITVLEIGVSHTSILSQNSGDQSALLMP